MQRKVILDFSCSSRAGRTSFLPLHGRTRRVLRRRLFLLVPRVGPTHALATIVFHNVRKPELNKIAMGFLFHRLMILGRGVTDLDKQTAAAQTALAETTSLP